MNGDYSRKIEKLYLEMYDMLLNYARCTEDGEALAEEAVQETFRLACQKPEQLLQSKNPQGWLVKALKYTLRNMKRSRTHAWAIMSAYLLANQKDVVFLEDRMCMQLMYEDISKTKELALLKELVIDKKSCLEIAKAHGISVSACKKRIQRAKETLKRKLDQESV